MTFSTQKFTFLTVSQKTLMSKARYCFQLLLEKFLKSLHLQNLIATIKKTTQKTNNNNNNKTLIFLFLSVITLITMHVTSWIIEIRNKIC